MFLNNLIKSTIFFIVFSPVILHIYKTIISVFNPNTYDYLLTKNIYTLLQNSFITAFSISTISLLIGVILTLIFIFLPPKKTLKLFYIILLLLIFSIDPIIFLSTIKNITLFNELSVFSQILLSMSWSFSTLSALILIVLALTINFNNIYISSMFTSLKNILYVIIKPQIMLGLIGVFSIIFIISFSSFNVHSVLGFRTYPEEFLIQISMIDSLEKSVFYALPFYCFSVVLTTLLIIFIKKYKIDFYIPEKSFISIKTSINYNWILLALFIIACFYLIFLSFLVQRIDFKNIVTLVNENFSVIFNSLIVSILVSFVTIILSIYIFIILQKIKNLLILLIFSFLIVLTFFLPSTSISLEILQIKEFFNINQLEFLFYIYAYMLNILPTGIFLIYIFHYKDVADKNFIFFNIPVYKKFLHIILPKHIFKWLSIFFILIIFSLNELATNILLIPIGFEIIIIRIYNLLHYGDYSTITFLSLVQIMILFFLLSLFFIIYKKVHK